MKGICLFCFHPRERLFGEKPYGASWRLTPERELFEWALLDANKSGTAEAELSLRLFVGRRRFFDSQNRFRPNSPTEGHTERKATLI